MYDIKKRPTWFTPRRVVKIFWVIITVIPLMGIIVSLAYPIRFYTTQADFRAFALKFGNWTPIAFIVLQALQVIITPISHYSVGYMGGFLFGTFNGSIFNYSGRLIGHFVSFWISRNWARRVVFRFVPPKTIQTYDRIANRPEMLFLIYFLPLFPDDEISYLIGLSTMPFKWFVIANLFGQLGGSVSLAYLGSGVSTRDPIFWILLITTILGFPLLWWLAKRDRSSTSKQGVSR